MGIWGNMLQTLHQKANVLWELILPRIYLDGNIRTCDPERLNTIVTPLNVNPSSPESKIMTPEGYIARYPALRYYAREQVKLGRKPFARGGQGGIYKAQLVSTSSIRSLPVIVKKFNYSFDSEYPGVVQGLFPLEFDTYRNMYVCKPTGFFFDNDGSLCMIMDQYSGDLRDLIDKKMDSQGNIGPPFTEPVAVSIIMQLALALKSLHGSKIYHKDLKCKNILVQTDRKEILIPSGALGMDFAVAISDFESSDAVTGTEFWRAPEVLINLKKRKPGPPISGIQWEKADIYSFGMVCYEILSGGIPLHDKRKNDYDHVVLYGGRPELPAHVPQDLREMIQKCWDENPDVRPTFAEIKTLLEDKYKELWAVGFSKVEDVMNWESTIGTPDAMLRELETLIDTTVYKLERHRNTASKFVGTVKEVKIKFGWSSFVTHPSLPFGKFVEREMFYTLLSSQYAEECDIYHEFVQPEDAEFGTKARVILLMEKVFFAATERAWKSEYCDEDLRLSKKLSIMEKDFVVPLLNAGANKLLIFKVAKRLLHEELSKYHQKGIERFQIRFMISILLLLVPECLLRMARLQDIVGSPGMEFLSKHIFLYFPTMCILLCRVFTKSRDERLSHFLKVFLDQFAMVLFLPVVTLHSQLKLLGWRGLLSWWLIGGIVRVSVYKREDPEGKVLNPHSWFHIGYVIWPFVAFWRCTGYTIWP